ncbi:MAG: outer membrane protein assembly factor BamD [Chitinophagales bacterium]|nr:outer membrane protein assembly factor BamD [Chitinophagales bacterium]
MKFRGKLLFFLIFAIQIALISCSQYQDLLKSDDYTLKLQKAKEFYEKGEYYRAQPLFDDLVNYYKGTKVMADVYYYYAYTYYGLGEYLLASYHFKTYANTYSDDPRAEECLFMSAKCYYRLSPGYELEQSYTEKAIDDFQLFVNAYPSSKLVSEANQNIDDMRRKLEIKAFHSAELYYNMGKYEGAILALENLLKDYPETPDAESASFLIVKSNYLYAVNSIPSKQHNRFENTIKSYQFYISQYNEGAHLKDAQDLYDLSQKFLNKTKNNDQEQAQRN